MEIKNFTITKRDGSQAQFSLDKIMNAIVKAFESVNEPADLGTISKIISHLDIHDDITVQNAMMKSLTGPMMTLKGMMAPISQPLLFKRLNITICT